MFAKLLAEDVLFGKWKKAAKFLMMTFAQSSTCCLFYASEIRTPPCLLFEEKQGA
jgi:hypothetical protein